MWTLVSKRALSHEEVICLRYTLLEWFWIMQYGGIWTFKGIVGSLCQGSMEIISRTVLWHRNLDVERLRRGDSSLFQAGLAPDAT